MTQNNIVLVVSTSIINNNNDVLLIKENRLSEKNKWNFPSGHIEQGEDILLAACREAKEETGYDIRLTHTTGVYNFISRTNHQVILLHFVGAITGGSLKLEEDEITDSKWIPQAEILEMENGELRNPGVMKQIARSLIDKDLYPITLFKDQLVSLY
ncbi:ADP-ribose pyrophosphatase YjhB, NUDIX family [Bacillus sp. OV322]|uniref:NUDIX hydrolase n=1 Tax=Bacillus sp. OV322 TaxID=1882764 RepID=UPI0008E648CF|nr:NUDIX domain-containing protein [Bacillus sp. OV322]SFC40438.1 ADP-ribose pyrophosphatase YjhB, NUDIX family [Bacillus sp. OV322]